jgi:hypothetical protein
MAEWVNMAQRWQKARRKGQKDTEVMRTSAKGGMDGGMVAKHGNAEEEPAGSR